jgi:8-oxo-dGTP pyrophosphatase MutT (NUDIX family)
VGCPAGRASSGGGGVGRRETPEEAAIREAEEEVGIQLDTQTMRSHGSYVTDHEGKIDTVYVFSFDTTQDARIGSDEIAETAWFPCSQVPEPISVQATKSLDRYHSTKNPA